MPFLRAIFYAQHKTILWHWNKIQTQQCNVQTIRQSGQEDLRLNLFIIYFFRMQDQIASELFCLSYMHEYNIYMNDMHHLEDIHIYIYIQHFARNELYFLQLLFFILLVFKFRTLLCLLYFCSCFYIIRIRQSIFFNKLRLLVFLFYFYFIKRKEEILFKKFYLKILLN